MPVQLKEITFAHSPDSDDAFMFYALAHNLLRTDGLKINQVLKDIQSLNLDAQDGIYEASAISFAAYPLISNRYALMPCGASMGNKYGPVVVSKSPLSRSDLKKAKLAIPGKLTTAFLTLRLYEPEVITTEMPFDQILPAVESGEFDAGLIIHEGQLTYERLGLKKVIDLGEWWFDQTNLPLPLGGNIIRKDLGEELIQKITKLMYDSIKYSLEHRREALSYAMTFAKDMQERLADKFVGMYVNELTLDYGEIGQEAVSKLFKMAYEQGVWDKSIQPEFVRLKLTL